ncbi:MAG TPA: hypothetical protein VF210_21730 [Pseudomonadales bacterium]
MSPNEPTPHIRTPAGLQAAAVPSAARPGPAVPPAPAGTRHALLHLAVIVGGFVAGWALKGVLPTGWTVAATALANVAVLTAAAAALAEGVGALVADGVSARLGRAAPAACLLAACAWTALLADRPGSTAADAVLLPVVALAPALLFALRRSTLPGSVGTAQSLFLSLAAPGLALVAWLGEPDRWALVLAAGNGAAALLLTRLLLGTAERGAARRQAERAALARAGRLLERAAHDLRQPVSAMSLYLMQLECRASDDTERNLCVRLRVQVRVLDELLESLGQAAQLRTRAFHRDGEDAAMPSAALSQPTAFDAGALIAELGASHRMLAAGRSVALVEAIDTAPVVYGDRALIRRIVGNLLLCALTRATRGSVRVEAAASAGAARIAVRTSEGSARGGGIGVELARDLAAHLGLPLRISEHEAGGWEAELRLPLVGSARRPARTGAAAVQLSET